MADDRIDIATKAYIASALPASDTLSAYQALTWTQIKGIVSIGSLGFTHAMIEVPDLESGITQQIKGAETGQTANIAFRHVPSDAGQEDVEAAAAARGEVALKIVDPDGTNARFVRGELHSFVPNEASTTSYKGATFSFTPNMRPIYGAATGA